MQSKYIFVQPPETEAEPNFKGFLAQYQLSERTIIEYDKAIALFFKSFKTFSQRNVNIFLKGHPRMMYVSAIKRYCIFKKVDIDIPRIKVPARLPRGEPSREELLTIVNRLKLEGRKRDAKFVMLIQYETGARIEEVLKLLLKNIDFEKCVLNFETKGGQFRSAPISATLRDSLKAYLRDEKCLFAGEKIFFTGYKKTHTAHVKFLEILDRTGDSEIEKVMKTHNFRRAVANEILDKSGGNIMMAKEALGHKDIRTTERCYASERTKEKIKAEAFKLLQSG